MINTLLVKELTYFKVFVSIPPFSMIQDLFFIFQGPDCSASKETGSPSVQGPVIFELKGCLSPEKKIKAGLISNDKSVGDEVTDTQDSSDGKINESRKELGFMTPHKIPVNQPKVCIFIHQFS
jgi:hypothetical protein